MIEIDFKTRLLQFQLVSRSMAIIRLYVNVCMCAYMTSLSELRVNKTIYLQFM